MSDPNAALASAIWTALDAALADPVHMLGRVPPDAAMPYTAIGPIEARDASRLNSVADRTMVYIDHWRDTGSTADLDGVVATIFGLLHRQRLSLGTGEVVFAKVVRRGPEPDLRESVLKGHLAVECWVEH
jgi:hypothetical protein